MQSLYIAYFLFLLIGITLGLIGGGGSILSVPVLVYLLNYPPDVATGYSLFIVGITALIGALSFVKKGNISFESLIQFAIPSLLSVFLVRKFMLPAMPDVVFNLGNFAFTKQLFIMLVFSLLILLSSFSMIKNYKPDYKKDAMWNEFAKSPLRLPFVILLGVFVGLITGFVGAGGGFIIIPVLLFLMRIPMKKAIGTSLCIIALNSLIGFSGTIGTIVIEWKMIFVTSSVCISGILIGNRFNTSISATKLKKSFGWFTLMVGVFILVKELTLK